MRDNAPLVERAAGLTIFLWIIQVSLAIQYVIHGWLFISPPAAAAEGMARMGVHPAFRQFIGFAELMAAVGLILPGLTGILTWLTPLAAFGLTIVMTSATIYHFARNELPSAISTANLLALVSLTAYLRWKVVPVSKTYRKIQTSAPAG